MTGFRSEKVWKYALVPTLVVLILALYPQLTLWIAKGSSWQGSYYVSNYDEVAYSAYVNALAAGKQRTVDPFLETADTHESLYSVQFIPAYFIAYPAKLLGVSTSTTFIILSIFIAVFSSLALFWLLREFTGDDLLSAVGVILVLCLGTAAAFQGELRFWIEGNVLVDFFPFLRRYQPGFAFGLFFVFCVLVRRSFSSETRKDSLINAAISGLVFAVLVFSYFYLWTAAAAWLAVAAILHFLWNRESRSQVLITTAVVGGIGIAALIPYYLLLSNRSGNIDSIQLLSLTHAPNFLSPVLILGLIAVFGIIVLNRKGNASLNSPKALFGLSFALTPLILFNQQMITGRSLQPVHYEIFIANYLVLVSIVLLISMLTVRRTEGGDKPGFQRAFVYAAILAAVWGFIEAAGATGRNNDAAYLRDESVAAIRAADGEALARPVGKVPRVMLATNFVTSDFIPTVSTLRPLWNPHTSSAGGVSVAENKRLFYLFLYFSGYTDRDLAETLRAGSFEVTAAVFGSERALPALGESSRPISPSEIDAEVSAFRDFSKNFKPDSTWDPELSYLLVPVKAEPNYSNVDRWYQRDEGREFGRFRLYTLTRRRAL